MAHKFKNGVDFIFDNNLVNLPLDSCLFEIDSENNLTKVNFNGYAIIPKSQYDEMAEILGEEKVAEIINRNRRVM